MTPGVSGQRMKAIITFHSIDNRSSVLSYSPAFFSSLLAELAAKEIPIMDIGSLLSPDVIRGVALTFDDGMKSVLENAMPLLEDYAATAHVFITSEAVSGRGLWPEDRGEMAYEMLSWDDIATLHSRGISIDAHTRSHPDLRTLSRQQIVDECMHCNEMINSHLGCQPAFFAYPFGYHNKHVRESLRGYYQAAVTTELRYIGEPEDPMALPRLDSYYLQRQWAIGHVAGGLFRNYVRLRSALRNIRGSQCLPDCG